MAGRMGPPPRVAAASSKTDRIPAPRGRQMSECCRRSSRFAFAPPNDALAGITATRGFGDDGE